MDELEKNVPETEDENLEEKEAQTQENEQSLETELEQLRDMFQQELDKAMNEEETDEVLIQELDEIEEETEDEQDEDIRLCECCGEKRCDTSFGDDYPYCTECRELMKANPLNVLGVIMAVAMFLVAGLSLGMTTKNIESYTNLLDANSAYAENQLIDAANTYVQYLNTAKNSSKSVSMKAVRNTIDIMEKVGDYEYCTSFIDTYFTESSLKLPWNKKYAVIKQEYEKISEAMDFVNDNFGEAFSGDKLDYKKNIKKVDKLIEECKDDDYYNKVFLEHSKFYLMYLNKDDESAQLAQLSIIEKMDNGKLQWLYAPYILNIYEKMGDTENAKVYFDKAVALNAQDLSAYNSYANAIRFGKYPDADKILEIAQSAAAVASQSSYPTYYRIYAIAYLMKGDADKALNNMSQYLQNCQPTVSDFNLYALCATEAKDKDTYKEAKETLEMYGYKLGSSVVKHKNGKMTLEEVLFEKGGDI